MKYILYLGRWRAMTLEVEYDTAEMLADVIAELEAQREAIEPWKMGGGDEE